ncbi:MAG: carboxypeptidase regulatory-like domain-containing protein [Candidatus Omnitrophica bacterium]|nr:carboxypeptidase regulatory-like domain-containing protein [Candidatus Omnitrophota bacterium]
MIKKMFFGLMLAGIVFSFLSSAMADGGGTITGKVVYKGEAITPQPINFGPEKACAASHKDKMPVNEDIVINPDNTVKWAFVRIKEDVPGDYPAPTDPVIIEQNGCIFTPHGAAVRVGQPVEFHNNDEVLHNVRGASKEGQAFNVAQPLKGMKTKKTFAKPEMGMQLKCDVHFWMAAYLHVMANPFYAITGDDGSFTIKDLPPGDYTLELWHEKLGILTKPVSVKAGETQTVDFELEKK